MRSVLVLALLAALLTTHAAARSAQQEQLNTEWLPAPLEPGTPTSHSSPLYRQLKMYREVRYRWVNGTLTTQWPAEFDCFHGCSKNRCKAVDCLMQDVDHNGDMRVSLDELNDAIHRHAPAYLSIWLRNAAAHYIKRFDGADGSTPNGMIGISEAFVGGDLNCYELQTAITHVCDVAQRR